MKLCYSFTIFLILIFFLASNAKRIGEAAKLDDKEEKPAEHRDLQYFSAGWPGLFSTSFAFLCFSSHATADVKGIGKVTMNQLKVGDQVLTSSGNYETVYAMAHRHASKSAEFIQIYSSLKDDPLEMTEKHMIFLDGNPNPVPASAVKVGDQLKTLDGPRYVTKISKVTRNGIFNPLTVDGTIVVNGIVTSVYSALLSNHDWIEITGHKVMTHQSFFS